MLSEGIGDSVVLFHCDISLCGELIMMSFVSCPSLRTVD